jgi:hypothetical protein
MKTCKGLKSDRIRSIVTKLHDIHDSCIFLASSSSSHALLISHTVRGPLCTWHVPDRWRKI